MTAHAAVGVDDDFTTGESGVTLRAANNEAAGRVDEEFCGCVEEVLWNHLANDICDQKFPDFLDFDFFGVLGRDDDIRHADGFAILIENGNLAFRVRAEPFHLAGFADGCEFAAEAVGEHDWRWHQLRGLVAGVAEHEALVAGSLLGGGFAFGFFVIHALRDVGALCGEEV